MPSKSPSLSNRTSGSPQGPHALVHQPVHMLFPMPPQPAPIILRGSHGFCLLQETFLEAPRRASAGLCQASACPHQSYCHCQAIHPPPAPSSVEPFSGETGPHPALGPSHVCSHAHFCSPCAQTRLQHVCLRLGGVSLEGTPCGVDEPERGFCALSNCLRFSL